MAGPDDSQPGSPSTATNPHDPSSPTSPSTNAAPSSQTPGHPSFRRQRASRACQTCHTRKVRCDAASLGVPCTNCVAFSIECKIPAPKRKRTTKSGKQSDGEDNSTVENDPPVLEQGNSPTDFKPRNLMHTADSSLMSGTQSEQLARQQELRGGEAYAQVMRPKFARAPIKDAGRVAYLGESSNLSLLVHDNYGTTDAVHYPLPDNVRGSRAKMTDLDNNEIEILHQRGAFLLPPRSLCDELIEAFFTWVAPVVPVINRARFMRRYNDSKNPPSLLLLQAMLLAGSRVCKNPQLMDANGSTTPAAMTFYKRAKALFDANYEDDRVTIVQALILMGWYWEGPEDVTRNVFFWTRVAIIVAQGTGMHRSVESSQLTPSDKRLWKRIWWTLFTRDRSVAVALGRPCCINIDDSDVEMLTEDDFLDDEPDRPSEYPPDPVHVQFFLSYVRLTEIMGLVLSQQYSVASKKQRQNALDLTHSDMALADWLQNCPKEVCWEKSNHHFWAALLHANYYTTLCLLHRAHMPPAGTPSKKVENGIVTEQEYPSRNIAYQAAGMITSIVEALKNHDELRYTPAFIVYSLFSALIMHVYQMRSSNTSVVATTEQRLHVCLAAVKEVSKIWLVAKMVHTLFESILGNKQLEERLQKAPGRRHQRQPKIKPNIGQPVDGPNQLDGQRKRKFDDVDLSYNNGTPTAQVSYERSRPQTPAAVTPSREMQASSSPNLMLPQQGSGILSDVPRNDVFLTNSGNPTRQTTPFTTDFNAPDLFLVTRNSPNLSQDVLQNFQPNQLFPADTTSVMPELSPSTQGFLDPALASTGASMSQILQSAPPSTQYMSQGPNSRHNSQTLGNAQFAHRGSNAGQAPAQHQAMHMGMHAQDPSGWAHVHALNQRHGSSAGMVNDDTWSNSSMSQPNLPTTVNVEDWFNFFGMSGGDVNGLSAFA